MAEACVEGEEDTEITDIDEPLLCESLNLAAAATDLLTSPAEAPASAAATAVAAAAAVPGQTLDKTDSDGQARRRLQSDLERHASLYNIIDATHRQLAEAFDQMQLALNSSITAGQSAAAGVDDSSMQPPPWRIGGELADFGTQNESTSQLRAEQRLLVFGGPSSGKSSLINRLLGEDIMPIGIGSSLMCQAGLMHLHFSERPFVRFSGSAFPNQPAIELNPARPLASQIRAFLQADNFEPQRQAWAAMDGCALEIGARSELMRCRLAFVEVPSDCVDHLVRERLLRELARSRNHTVVYVIDSQKGFCNQDREFLLFLRANRPEDRVIYIANKVDYDPEAEFMDGNTDDEDSEDEEDAQFDKDDEHCSSVHTSGEETQKRKMRLVTDQLTRYRLVHPNSGRDGRARSLFPLSLIRLRVPLAAGPRSPVQRFNRQYRADYNELEEALFANLLETSSAAVDAAIGALFLKASLAFDAFARDPAKEEAESKGPAAKDLVRFAVTEARERLEHLKQKLRMEITKLHQDCEASIIEECAQLEFGPLRLHNRIRNNEVEQQYRTQLHNFALHLLNSEVSIRMDGFLSELRAGMALLIGRLQSQLTKEASSGAGFVDSQWNAVVRMQTQEAQCVAAKMHRLSIEWEGDFKFFTWMRRLVSKKGQASGGAIFSTREWKASVAKDFYQRINVNAVVKKFFTNLEAKLLQTERRLLCLAASRQRCGTRLRRMLRKSHLAACSAWRAAQRCLATADALRSAQRYGLVKLGDIISESRLGCQRALADKEFGGYTSALQAATVLRQDGPLGSVCSLYLGQRHQRRWLLSAEQTVAPLMVALDTNCRLCVLHNAYTCSLADALQNHSNYSNRQAFWLLQSLLQLSQMCAAASAALESGTEILNELSASSKSENCCTGCSWLTCDTLRVRFEADFATAMLDCLEQPLQLTKSKKHQQQIHQLHRQHTALQTQLSTNVQQSPLKQMKEACKRSRSLDPLGDGGGPAPSSTTSAAFASKSDEKPWERRELDNFLLLALMILCRRRLDLEIAQLVDWSTLSAMQQQQQQPQQVGSVASLSELLARIINAQESSIVEMVVPQPWECIARLMLGANEDGGAETRWDRISNFIEDGLKRELAS